MDDYMEKNKKLWNDRVGFHLNSAFYDKENFLKGKLSISPLEQHLLGNVKGKSLLHLQCHFGMDTISLSRMKSIATGVDFSDKAIEAAQHLAFETGENTEFICSDIYELPSVLKKRFDVVFTSFGVIGWLPDLEKWAAVIEHFLKPGGRFLFAEFHPVVWMFDNEFKNIQHSYFNHQPINELELGTYADKEAPIALESITWNHSLDEVFQSLIHHHIEIIDFREYDYSPFDCFPESVRDDQGQYRIKGLEKKIPISYTITGKKKKEPH